jgi:hypothetical protein
LVQGSLFIKVKGDAHHRYIQLIAETTFELEIPEKVTTHVTALT